MPQSVTRRGFLMAAGGAIGVTAWHSVKPANSRSHAPAAPTIVLFQGDSITDSGRDRSIQAPNSGAALGTGYPLLIASALLRDRPDRDLQFFNRGISGNRVPDLRARWETDTIALQPDLLSVLIGVNDLWHRLEHDYTGTVSDYEEGYTALLKATREALPDTRIVVMEPFVLRTGTVDDRWYPEFDERRAAAAQVAQQLGVMFVPLQAMFDELAAEVGPAHWAADGVHPTPAGHAAIAEQWHKVVQL